LRRIPEQFPQLRLLQQGDDPVAYLPPVTAGYDISRFSIDNDFGCTASGSCHDCNP
jgi:hypothetical protein